MLQIFIPDFDIAHTEPPRIVAKAALQNQRQFQPIVAVVGHGLPGRNIKQTNGSIVIRRQDVLPDTHAQFFPARRTPFHRFDHGAGVTPGSFENGVELNWGIKLRENRVL